MTGKGLNAGGAGEGTHVEEGSHGSGEGNVFAEGTTTKKG